MKLAFVLVACIATAVSGAERGPFKVIFIPDALTLTAQSPDEDEPERIGLRWLAAPPTGTPEGDAVAADAVKALRALLPPGTMIKLVTPEAEPPRDRKGRLLALIVGVADGSCVQESQVRSGWAAFVPAPDLMPEWRERLTTAAAVARAAKSGIWAFDPTWMETHPEHEQK